LFILTLSIGQIQRSGSWVKVYRHVMKKVVDATLSEGFLIFILSNLMFGKTLKLSMLHVSKPFPNQVISNLPWSIKSATLFYTITSAFLGEYFYTFYATENRKQLIHPTM